MRSLFDVNVLIALLDPEHAHHEAAHDWWERNTASGWATCPLTQNGFIRIVSQQSYIARLALSDAFRRLAREIARPNHVFWPDDISITDQTVFDHARILGPKQMTDVYLLGLAVKNNGRFVTLDDAIPLAAVRGARKEQMVVL